MSESEFIKTFFTSAPARHVRMAVARGLAPVLPNEMLLLLAHLARDPDAEIADVASHTLSEWPEDDLLAQLRARDCRTEVLSYFASAPQSGAAIQEAVITHPSAPAAAVAALALHVSASLLELILYNRSRLLDFPEILQNAKLNPAASPQILGLVQEIETEFFGLKKREYLVGDSEAEAAARDDSLDLVAEIAPDDLSLEGLPLDPQEREAAILSRLSSMTVLQKVKLALMGTREVRFVLIRDSNRQVSQSVLRSPKLAIGEVESFAAMRGVADEVLRQIGNSKEWTKSYAVVLNLAKNPKTPPAISQRMLFRLHARDLMLLSRDHGIPEAVRRNAQRLISQRMASKSIG
jgi:hypothetical protein